MDPECSPTVRPFRLVSLGLALIFPFNNLCLVVVGPFVTGGPQILLPRRVSETPILVVVLSHKIPPLQSLPLPQPTTIMGMVPRVIITLGPNLKLTLLEMQLSMNLIPSMAANPILGPNRASSRAPGDREERGDGKGENDEGNDVP